MYFHTGRHAFVFEPFQRPFDLASYFGDIRTTQRGDGDAQCPPAVVPQLVADRIFVPFGNGGDVAEPQLVVLMSLQQQAADVLRCAVTVVHGYAQPGTAAFVVSGVHGFVLSVQGGEDLCRMYPEVGEFVFVELYVNALRPLAVDVHLRDAFDFHHLLFHEFGVPCGLCVGIAVEGHGVEHAEYVAEIVHYHGYGGSFGQLRLYVGHFAAENVPALFRLFVRDECGERYVYQGHVVHRAARHLADVLHRPNALLQHIRHFEFHLMGGGSRIDRDHGGLFHLDFGVFELAHVVIGEDAAYRQYGDEEVYQLPVVECPVS